MSGQDLLERFWALDIDHGSLGLMQRDFGEPYFCTPVGAEILGWTGVDGVHFCRVPAVDPALVFVVTPIPCGEHCVEPVARDIETFFRLLLACGGANLLEGVSYVGEERFRAWLEEDRASMDGARAAALDKLREALALEPCPDPYRAIKSLQNSFDNTTIPFSEEYYEATGEEPPAGRLPRPGDTAGTAAWAATVKLEADLSEET